MKLNPAFTLTPPKPKPVPQTVMYVVCCYCQRDMGTKDGKGTTGVSHGICEPCAARLMPKSNKRDVTGLSENALLISLAAVFAFVFVVVAICESCQQQAKYKYQAQTNIVQKAP